MNDFQIIVMNIILMSVVVVTTIFIILYFRFYYPLYEFIFDFRTSLVQVRSLLNYVSIKKFFVKCT